MRLYLILLTVFLVTVNAALGSVGGAGISDTNDAWLQQGSSTGTSAGRIQMAGTQTLASQQPSIHSLQFYQGGLAAGEYIEREDLPLQAPEARGPAEEQLTAEILGLSLPQMDSFTPDASLGFASASYSNDAIQTVPANAPSTAQHLDLTAGDHKVQSSVQFPVQSTVQSTAAAFGAWHYPGSIVSANRFYVQTHSGLSTVGGCGYGGYLPLWADIRAGGNFFVYEWYPDQSNPYVHYLGWTGTGWKRGWFGGDVPGWHILCYNSGLWSNYIYIYVYPVYASSGYSYSAAAQPSRASGYQAAPTPPNPGGEGLVMPDFNLYRPSSQTSAGYNYPIRGSGAQQAAYAGRSSTAPISGNPAIAGTIVPGASMADPGSSGFPAQSANAAATFTSSTLITSGVIGSTPHGALFPASSASFGSSAPAGYVAHGYNAVYPRPSACRCNEYYVQSCPGELDTVAGVFCGEWLPLWSKISRPGDYWSFEWKICGGSSFCPPEVRNFGHKGEGWYQTWFMGDHLGWHILSYHSNDWSNYIYIYVWPEE